MKRQTGVTEPLRDWFPLSASSVDVATSPTCCKGPGADWGTLKCGCHPDCGVGTALHGQQEDQGVGAAVGVPQRRAACCRTRRPSPTRRAGRTLTRLQTALSLLRNYSPTQRAEGLPARSICCSKFDKQSGGQLGGTARRVRRTATASSDEWLLMFVAGMWFQDLWTYDFRRTEMCIIPVRDADGRDLVLRLQHRRRLAADRREDVPERHASPSGTRSTASTPSTRTRRRRCRCRPRP